MQTPRETSPWNLAQERYRDHPWKLLVACILYNRVKGTHAAKVASAFFERWPNAIMYLWSKPEEVVPVLQPLGFQNRREQRIRGLSAAWLDWDMEDPTDLPGVGKYGAESYNIFVKGVLPEPSAVGDKELKRYSGWAHGPR